MIGEHLAEAGGTNRPLPRLGHRVLELCAHTQLGHRARPPLAAGTALVAEAAQVVALLAREIPIARNVEAGRAPPGVILVVESLELARCTTPEVVVHQVMP